MAITKQFKKKLRKIAEAPIINARARNMRKTVRRNADGSESTHLMSSADNTAYPTLFPNKDGSWKELKGWDAYDEAKRRGELFHFDTPEEANKFAKGSWKKKK